MRGVQVATVAGCGIRRRCALAHTITLSLLLFFCALWTAAPAGAADDTTQAAQLADRLRDNPVYVTDQLPREVPRSTAPDFARAAERTGVPTYVLVLPGHSADDGEALLGAVHDRLGRDGLYVLVDYLEVTDAVAFGVKAPAEDALTVASYELPYDAGPLRSFERFADVVAQGSAKAAAQAEAARERYGDSGAGKDPEARYIGPTDRENQAFLTGIVLTGVPLLILLLGSFVRRWRRRLPSARGNPGSGTPSRLPRGALPGIVLLTAVAIALGAWLTFDQTTSSAAQAPTAADLSARVDRVVKGLKQDPVYTDPESQRVLDAGQRARLRDRISEFGRSEGGGPVFVSVVPLMTEDESAGNADVFASAVHAGLGRDGVYVVADPIDGDINAVSYSVPRVPNRSLFDLPDSVQYDDSEARDHQLGDRLGQFMTFVEKAPRTDEPDYPATDRAPEPVDDHALAPLFSGDFWPGLIVGAFAALVVFALLAGVLAIVGTVLRRRNPAPLPSGALPFEAPTDPSLTYLRRTARSELLALQRQFTDNPEQAAHIRAWDCFDGAMLLVDGDVGALADDAVEPASLVAVIVLSRAGRAALSTEADSDDSNSNSNSNTYNLCCGLNPLHGPAVSRHHVRISAEGRRRSLLPVCQMCRETAIVEPSTVHTLRMTLPGTGPGRGDRVPYEEVTGPLPAVRDGIPQLINQIRESTSVR